MGLLTLLRVWHGAQRADPPARPRSGSNGHLDPDSDRRPDREVQCRNCGRYYPAGGSACPHCGSGNQLRDGAPPHPTA